ncbi:MAG: FCD domain-containing protein [Pseudooceanicola sp.]|nr:FCD domain-containing protein [Pseudooceanicola sp.]
MRADAELDGDSGTGDGPRAAGEALFRERDAATGPMTGPQSMLQARRVIRGIVAGSHDRPSLVAQIASEVGAEIVEGAVPPGHDLNTVELARRYHTSRTPVREALMLLEREGLVDIPPRRRPRAHAHTIEEVREIYITRTAIFELIAIEVARNAVPSDIQTLDAVIRRMQRAAGMGDVTAFTWLSVQFHDTDSRIARNNTARRIHDSLLLRTLAIRRLSLSQPARMAKSLEDHIQLVKAYEANDPNLAGAIMRANHTAALAAVEKHFTSGGALVAPPVA